MNEVDVIPFDRFCEFFKALTSFLGRRDADPNMLGMYYKSLERMQPTHDEVWNAIAQIIDAGDPSAGLPSATEFKKLIFQARGVGQLQGAIAPAEPEPPVLIDSDRAEMRLTILATILRDQGDSRFYREMLQGKTVYSGIVGDAPLTHESVQRRASELAGSRKVGYAG